MKKESEEWELEELEEIEPDPEDDRWAADADGQPGPRPMKTSTMLLVFLGLAVLAAIICGVLWGITHRDRAGEENPGTESTQGTQEGSSGMEGNPEQGSGSEDFSSEPGDGENAGAGDGASEASDGESGSGAVDPSVEPEQGTDPSGESEQGSEAVDPSVEPEQGSEAVDPSRGPEQGTGAADASKEPEDGGSELSGEPEQGNNTAGAVSGDANRVSTLDGRVIVFTDCDDTVSPKEYVNLRLEPSTSEGNATVHCRLNYGETVRRTGISEDSGWSRVEKDGVVCYVVTSFVYVVEEQSE